MTMYRTDFVVEGSGTFPFDMLRYDTCFPTKETEMGLLCDWRGSGAQMGTRRISLAVYHDGKTPRLTDARWRSFLWHIVPESISTVKR